jgi:phosphoglycolate phosphatase
VFDLDGTLVDSRRDLADAANAVLEASGARPLSEAAIGRMVGEGAATLVARAFAATAVAQPADALDRFLEIYATRLLVHTRAYPGVSDVLASLRAHAPLAVLTNKPIAATREILAGLELARFFDADAVLGGDGPHARKPDPSGLRYLCERVGAPPGEALLVGDSRVDLRTARAAGASICLARYGFGFQTIPKDEIEPTDGVIDTPADILSVYGKNTLA